MEGVHQEAVAPHASEGARYEDATVADYVRRFGAECAHVTMSWAQILRYALVLAVLFLFANYDYKQFFILVNFIVCSLYIITVLFKFVTVALSLVLNREVKVTDEELARWGVDEVPVYTILVPLYRESEIAGSILKAIHDLEYPRSKLDVKILLEADDPETAAAIDRAGLPDYCQVITVPKGAPRTKPRACNHGLREARGQYVVIYDAEDRPERDQLKR